MGKRIAMVARVVQPMCSGSQQCGARDASVGLANGWSAPGVGVATGRPGLAGGAAEGTPCEAAATRRSQRVDDGAMADPHTPATTLDAHGHPGPAPPAGLRTSWPPPQAVDAHAGWSGWFGQLGTFQPPGGHGRGPQLGGSLGWS